MMNMYLENVSKTQKAFMREQGTVRCRLLGYFEWCGVWLSHCAVRCLCRCAPAGIEGDEEHKVDLKAYVQLAEDLGCNKLK